MQCTSVYRVVRDGKGEAASDGAGRQQRETHHSFPRQAGTGSAHPRCCRNLHRSMWCPGSTRCAMRLCTAVEWYPSARCLAAPARTAPQRTAVAPATGAVSRPALPRQRSRRPLWHQAASLAARQPAAPSSDAHAMGLTASGAVAAQPASGSGPRAAQRDHRVNTESL